VADAQVDLAALRRVAEEVAAEWALELGEPFALSRYSYVAPAGGDAVLKVVSPDDDESDEEGDALELWDGDGAVRLLRRDRKRKALLIERARPGDDASALPEDEATAVAVDVGRRLWRPAGAPFRSIHDHVPRWLADAERERQPGSELVPLARELYDRLGRRDDTLIHGDFHHHNLLRHGGSFVAIDAKAMRGEPEYELWSFLHNPLDYRMKPETTERRLAAFERSGLDPWRMRAWAVVRAAWLGADANEVAVLRRLLD
jgi:streptomycin 6-kinase